MGGSGRILSDEFERSDGFIKCPAITGDNYFVEKGGVGNDDFVSGGAVFAAGVMV